MSDPVQENTKKAKGQFYTVNSQYILEGLTPNFEKIDLVMEPFAGKGDLIEWVKKIEPEIRILGYDIDPKQEGIYQRDTILNPPIYENTWVITNPPYLARNKSEQKHLFDFYSTNDLYKCFILSITNQKKQCKGGIFIIPAGFFMSPRDVDTYVRNEFLSKYRILRVKYFEETVFPDTSTTVVAFLFEKSNEILTEQSVEWISMPSKKSKVFTISVANNWIIGGDIYRLPTPPNIKIRRFVVGQDLFEDEQLTNLTLAALDSGTQSGRIRLEYKKDYVYPAKESSRTYATLCIIGARLSEEKQIEISGRFNEYIEKKREETWSLFLPQYRESKEYARKRIPFELAYKIVLYLINTP